MATTTREITTTVKKRNGEEITTREVKTSTTLGKVVKGVAIAGVAMAILSAMADSSSS